MPCCGSENEPQGTKELGNFLNYHFCCTSCVVQGRLQIPAWTVAGDVPSVFFSEALCSEHAFGWFVEHVNMGVAFFPFAKSRGVLEEMLLFGLTSVCFEEEWMRMSVF